MAEYLLADIGSTFTKLCLVDAAVPAVVASASAPTTVATDVNEGFDRALERLREQAGEAAADPGRWAGVLACSSAAGGLRIAAVGLVPALTLQAARLAALGAGGKVVGAFSYQLTGADLEALAELRPDLVLLSGGTDGGDRRHILANARLLQEHLPSTPLIVAGNRAARDELQALFAGRADVFFTANVMPEVNRLDLQPARESIRTIFLERIVHAKGLDRLQRRAEVLMPTPEAVLQGVSLLARGLPGSPGGAGWGDLLLVDIGGATTDVYSCAAGLPESSRVVLKGLREPFEKRTVEADIGMRHTVESLLEQSDAEALARAADCTPGELADWAGLVRGEPGRVAQNAREASMDAVLARAACDLAVGRHCGVLEETYAPEGKIFIQEGKDLGGVRRVIGSGGPLAHSRCPGRILEGARRTAQGGALKPRAPEYLVDGAYLVWAMGLLSEKEPAAALALMDRMIRPA